MLETIIIILLITGICLALFHPLIGIFTFFAVAYLRPQDFYPALVNMEPARLIIIATLISFLFYKIRSRSPFIGSKQGWGILGILTAILLSRFQALDPIRWFAATQDFAVVCLMFFLTINLLNNYKKLRWFYILYLILNIIVALRFYLAYKSGTAEYHGSKPGDASFGFLGNADDLGLGMVVAFPLALIPVFYARSIFTKLLCAGFSCLFILAALGTQSRGAIFGIFAVFIVTILLHMRGRKLRYTKYAVGLAIVFMLFAGFYYKYRWQLNDSYTTAKDEEDSGRIGRMYAWAAAREMIKDSPIVGIGRGNFPVYWYMNFNAGEYGYQVAHNIIYEVASETGLIGLFSFLFFSLYGLVEIHKFRKKYAQALEKNSFMDMIFAYYIVALIGFYFNGMFITVAFYWHVYVLVAIYVSAKNIFLKEVAYADTKRNK